MSQLIKKFSANNHLIFVGLSALIFYFFIALIVSYFPFDGFSYDLIFLPILFLYLLYFLSFQFFKTFPLKEAQFKIIFLFSVLFVIFLIFAVPVASTDFYHYFFEDAALVYHQKNPYLVTPNDLPFEPLTWLSAWHFLPAQHGPWRIFVTVPAVFFGAGNFVLTLLFYRITFGFFVLASIALFHKILELLEVKEKMLAFLLFSWNPLIFYGTFFNGGTDILMVFWLLLSLYFLLRKKYYFSTTFLVISFLTKYITLIFLPFFLVYLLSQSPGLKGKILTFLKHLFLISALVVGSFLPFWAGTGIFTGLFFANRFSDVTSFSGLVSLLFFFFNRGSDFYFFRSLFIYLFQAVFLIIYGYLLFRFFRLKSLQVKDLIYYNFLTLIWFLVLAYQWFYPKYLIWLLPLIFLTKKEFYPLGVFLTGFVVLAAWQVDLISFYFVVPVAIFGAFYGVKRIVTTP